MDSKFYNLMLAGYKERLDNSTLGEIELRAQLILEQEKNAELQARVTELETLLETSTAPETEKGE